MFISFRVDFYDQTKKKNTLMFTSDLRNVHIVNKHYQVFAMTNQIYIYKNWNELFDIVKTSPNDNGIFACASFKADEHRFILSTVGERSRCHVQIKDYVFNKDMNIEKVFGNEEEKDG
jgi:hypothetical protein